MMEKKKKMPGKNELGADLQTKVCLHSDFHIFGCLFVCPCVCATVQVNLCVRVCACVRECVYASQSV